MLPVTALLPQLIVQLFIMLIFVQAMLTGLDIAGFRINVKLWFERYTVMTIGPVLLGASVVSGARDPFLLVSGVT